MSDKATLLIVDDIKENIDMLKECLKSEYHIIAATSGEKALKIAKIRQPDLVLLDIMMPEMDGYEAITRIRAQNKFSKLPIIALTAKAMKEDKSRCIEVGASDYFPKPVDVEKLKSVMKVWLRQKQ